MRPMLSLQYSSRTPSAWRIHRHFTACSPTWGRKGARLHLYRTRSVVFTACSPTWGRRDGRLMQDQVNCVYLQYVHLLVTRGTAGLHRTRSIMFTACSPSCGRRDGRRIQVSCVYSMFTYLGPEGRQAYTGPGQLCHNVATNQVERYFA